MRLKSIRKMFMESHKPRAEKIEGRISVSEYFFNFFKQMYTLCAMGKIKAFDSLLASC